MIRPADEPITAELVPDWYSSLTEALTNRVELRRQKWNIKSLELQLRAARSLTRPRVDLVGSYGDNGYDTDLKVSRRQVRDEDYRAYSWGVVVSVPLTSQIVR